MNIEQARINMIEQQIRPWNVLDQDVLDLLLVVKREQYVPAAYQNLAFVDTAIPLAPGAAMFDPKLEARILQEVAPKKHENVLEIGAGSGYMAALLAHKAQHVTTVEINPELKSQAEATLAVNGVANVTVVQGDGAQGWAQGAPWDVIVISAALEVVPEAFLKQVKVGGRICAIVGHAPVMSVQIITRVNETAYSTVKVFETNVPYLITTVKPSSFHF